MAASKAVQHCETFGYNGPIVTNSRNIPVGSLLRWVFARPDECPIHLYLGECPFPKTSSVTGKLNTTLSVLFSPVDGVVDRVDIDDRVTEDDASRAWRYGQFTVSVPDIDSYEWQVIWRPDSM